MTKASEIVSAVGKGELHGPDAEISGATHDTRRVEPGDLFVCIEGGRVDGHDLAADAVAAGATALLVNRGVDVGVPYITVDDTRRWAGPFASAVYGNPSKELRLVGITGTNGKTTTTYLVEAIALAAGAPAGIIGNIHARLNGRDINTGRSTNTPEPVDLQRLLAAMRDAGGGQVTMEVTSQGLDRHRVAGVQFEVVAFTNLTQDHLDWHGDMETYFASKAQLFTADYAPLAVINTDDVWGSRLASQTPLEVLRVGGDGDVGAENVRLGRGGSEFTLCFPTGRVDVKFSLVGPFNVENALMAAGIAHALGFGMEAVKAGLESVASVPGRLETVDANTGFAVIVDYAHTPDAVSGVLRAARELTDAKLICVVGCGGDRDRTKRPLMGEAATALADFTVITSDNPRSEDPDAILDEVEPGAVQGGGKYERITDRRAAIRRAFEVADDGDVIVIAGKGHETGQEINGVVHPFDDRVVAAEIAGEL